MDGSYQVFLANKNKIESRLLVIVSVFVSFGIVFVYVIIVAVLGIKCQRQNFCYFQRKCPICTCLGPPVSGIRIVCKCGINSRVHWSFISSRLTSIKSLRSGSEAPACRRYITLRRGPWRTTGGTMCSTGTWRARRGSHSTTRTEKATRRATAARPSTTWTEAANDRSTKPAIAALSWLGSKKEKTTGEIIRVRLPWMRKLVVHSRFNYLCTRNLRFIVLYFATFFALFIF